MISRSLKRLPIVVALLALSGNYDRLTDYAVFALCIVYLFTAAAVLVLRRKMPSAERPYRVWGYPLTPALFTIAILLVLLNTLVTAPLQSAVGLGFIALGLPFYAYFSRTRREPEACVQISTGKL